MKKTFFTGKKLKELLKNDYLLLTLIFLIITPIFLVPWIHGNDGVGHYAYVRSTVIDHDLDFENERIHYNQTRYIASIQVDPYTGNHFNQYPFGTSLLWSPYFLIGHLIAFITGSAMDGYSMPYVYMVCLGSAINAFLGLLLVFSMLRKYFKRKIALLSLVTIWLASPLFYYMYFESSMSHANSFLVATLFIYFWHKTYNNRSTKQWIILGFLAGLTILVRYQNLILLGLPFIEVLPLYFSRKYKLKIKDIMNPVLSALIFFITVLPQLLIIISKHGALFGFRYGGQFQLSNVFSNFWKVLISAQHGVFNWTPILFFAFLGLFLLYKKKKLLACGFIFIFILNLILVSGWSGWYAGQSFGHRMFISLTVPFMFGLASLIERIEKKIQFKYIVITCLFFILWNFGLMVQYGTRMISAENAVAFKERFYNNLIHVPKKLWTIFKKFIFNRASFLQ
jgi:hypothetical protein